MARRLNYTGRQSIRHADIRIRLLNSSGNLSFAAALDLEQYRFPSDASVLVEAYRSLSASWKRFDFGKVAIQKSPPDLSLNEFERPEGILFRVKVAAGGDRAGTLCGEADGIRPMMPQDSDADPKALIDVDRAELGGEPWRVRFPEGNAGLPTLLMNNRIEDWNLRARDPLFRSLVLPSVMRQILAEILVIRADVGDEESKDEWPQKWLQFSSMLPGAGRPPQPLREGEQLSERIDLTDWIDAAVSGFGQFSGLTDSLIARWKLES